MEMFQFTKSAAHGAPAINQPLRLQTLQSTNLAMGKPQVLIPNSSTNEEFRS